MGKKEKNNLVVLSIVLFVGAAVTFVVINGAIKVFPVNREADLAGDSSLVFLGQNQSTYYLDTPNYKNANSCSTPTINYTAGGTPFFTIRSCYTLFSNFPIRFFDESAVPLREVVRTTDAQYSSLRKMHNGKFPYQFAKITYDPKVFGATTPEGIVLGDAAFPSLNKGHPRWELMSHEQGHNFFGETSAFYGALAFGHPFLQESLAVASAFFTYYDILINNRKEYFLWPNTTNSLGYDFGNGRRYQESQYNLYVSGGKHFNIDDVLTSQALDYKMIVYGEKYGFGHYTNFTMAFEDGISAQFAFHRDGTSATEQSTYVIAALGVAFNKDFRAEFSNLSFPINQTLYKEIYPKIASYINK